MSKLPLWEKLLYAGLVAAVIVVMVFAFGTAGGGEFPMAVNQ